MLVVKISFNLGKNPEKLKTTFDFKDEWLKFQR